MNQQEQEHNNSLNLLVQNPDLLLSCTSIDESIISNNNTNNVVNYEHSYSVIANTPTNQLVSSFGDFPSSSSDMSSQINNTVAPAITERQFSFDQFIQEDVSVENQREIRDEILDLNILELLQSEEPEMARLIDQASSLDSICNFLPQISVNTTNKVLDSLQPVVESSLPRSHSSFTSMLHELSKASHNNIDDDSCHMTAGGASCKQQFPVLFKLEDEVLLSSHQQQQNHQYQQPPPLQMHSSTSFKELCELLSIKKVPSSAGLMTVAASASDTTTPSQSQLTKLKLLTPPLTPDTTQESSLKPSRTSMRLFQKRNIKKEPMEVDEIVQTTSPQPASITKRRVVASSHRKKPESLDSASDSDEKSSSSSDSKPLNSSNENSMDLTSFYEPRRQRGGEDEDEDDDSEEDQSEQEDSDNDSSTEINYSRNGVKRRLSSVGRSSSRGRKSLSSSGMAGSLATPIKKESNKEAATRYRLKKISEKDKLFETRFNLEKENDSKRRQIELVQTEINYLKTILVQFILTKSCLNTNNNPMTATS